MSRFSNPNFPSRSSRTSTYSVGSSESGYPVPINPLSAPRLSPSTRTSKWLTKLPPTDKYATSPRFSHSSSVFSFLKDVPWASPSQSSASVSSVVDDIQVADPFANFTREYTAPVATTPPRAVKTYAQPRWLSKWATFDREAANEAHFAAKEAYAQRQPFKKGRAPKFSTIFCELARIDAEPTEVTPEVIETTPEIIEIIPAETDEDDTFDTCSLFLEEEDQDATIVCDAPVSAGLSITPIFFVADVTCVANLDFPVPGAWPEEDTDVLPPVAGWSGSWRPAIVALATTALLWGVSKLV